MSVTLLVMTDGRRDCISRTIPSALENLVGPVTRHLIFDDSGNPDYREWLTVQFPSFTVLHAGTRRGFGAAIDFAWTYLRDQPERFVFHLEDDFTFERAVDLEAMISVLDTHPHTAQLALRRQAWSPAEVAAGGVIEQHPLDYLDRSQGPHQWLEHRRFFTTNPSLYRRSLCEDGWPEGDHSEGHFAINLLADHPDWRFAFWGARSDRPWVTHIGRKRAGVGY